MPAHSFIQCFSSILQQSWISPFVGRGEDCGYSGGSRGIRVAGGQTHLRITKRCFYMLNGKSNLWPMAFCSLRFPQFPSSSFLTNLPLSVDVSECLVSVWGPRRTREPTEHSRLQIRDLELGILGPGTRPSHTLVKFYIQFYDFWRKKWN